MNIQKPQLTFILFTFLIILGFACQSPNEEAPASTAQPPNIIFLLADDHRKSAMGYAGNEIIQTPNLDDLAANGLYFENAYVTTSICAVSRASILTGQYARRHGIWDFSTALSDSVFSQTYPMLLKQAGYRVGFIGKYGVGRDMPEQAFDYWKGFPGQGKYEHTDSAGNYLHLTRLMGNQAVEFLQTNEEKPFCLSVSFKAPHVQDVDPRQFVYDSTYQEMFADAEIPLPETADSSYWEVFPEAFRYGKEGKHNEARRRWYMRFSDPEHYQESVKGYYRLIYGIDQVVGRLRETLAEQGMDENTVFVYIGDNGFYLGEHGMAGKWYGHEESIRVPFFIYDPRLEESQRGKRLEEIALNIDVAPTILQAAGIEAPGQMQGENLYQLAEGTPAKWRKDFLYEHLFEYKTIPMSEGVVGEQYKYMRYFWDNNRDDLVYEELFDFKNDPIEVNNLIDDEEYEELEQKLVNRLEELIEAKK